MIQPRIAIRPAATARPPGAGVGPGARIVAWGLAALLPLLCLVMAPATALGSAAMRRQAKQMSNKAAALFARKQFVEAADLFEQAYALDNRRLIRLRNAGRAWEEAGRPERALHCFERYLDRAKNKKLAADARERIARFKRLIAERDAREAKRKAQEEEARAAKERAAKERAAKDAAAKRAAKEKPPAAVSAGAGGRGGWWIIGGAGLAVLAGGAGWLAMTASGEAKVDEDEDAGHYDYAGGQDKLAADREAVARNRLGAWITGGVGLAAVGVATVMLLSDAPTETSLTVTPGPGWLAARWRF